MRDPRTTQQIRLAREAWPDEPEVLALVLADIALTEAQQSRRVPALVPVLPDGRR